MSDTSFGIVPDSVDGLLLRFYDKIHNLIISAWCTDIIIFGQFAVPG